MDKTSTHSTHAPGSRKFSNLAGAGVLLTVLALFLWPLLVQGQVPWGRDFSLVTYPVKHFLHAAWQAGALPFWNPGAHFGAPFLAEFHPGVFYPPSLFFLWSDFPAALNAFYAFHFVLLGVSVFYLARLWEMSLTAALASSITAVLSGYTLSAVFLSNFFLAGVWLPAIFFSFERLLATGRTRYLLPTVFGVACQTLAANPEISVLTCALLFFHTLFSVSGFGGTGRAMHWKASIGLVGLVAVALGLCAFQLAPTYELVQATQRSGGLPFHLHAQWSLDGDTFRSFVLPVEANGAPGFQSAALLPDRFLESIYMGVFVVLSAFLSVWFLKEKRIRFWWVAFLAGFLLALGKHNPLYAELYPHVPMLDWFRYPVKYIFISFTAGVFLVGFVWDALMRTASGKRLAPARVTALLLTVFFLVGAYALNAPGSDPGLSFVILFLFGGGYVLVYYGRLPSGRLSVLFLLLLFLDLSLRSAAPFPTVEREYYEEPPLLLQEIGMDRAFYRVYTGKVEQTPNRFELPNGPTPEAALIAAKEYMFPLLGNIYGAQFADGLPGLGMGLRDHLLWYQLLKRSPREKRWRILKRSNVRYWIDLDRPTPYRDGYPMILPDRLKILRGVLPRAFLVPRARAGTPLKLLNTYFDAAFDPRREVLIDAPFTFQPSQNFEGKVESIAYRPNGATVRTRQTGNGFLVLLDAYSPGWSVTVDGQPRPILRANHFFRAVFLDSGAHEVRFDFHPPGLAGGLKITGAAGLFLALAALWHRRRSRPS